MLLVKKFSIPFNIAATALADCFAIESGVQKVARITRIVITNPGLATAAGLAVLQLLRTTTAGATGVVVPAPWGPDDSAYTGIARSAPGTLGTAGVVLEEYPIWVPAAAAIFTPFPLDFEDRGLKDGGPAPTTFPGIANGIALRVNVGAGASGLRGFVEFVEERS